MGYKVDSDCVGCPQGCVHCGRGEYEVYYCDKCEDYTKELFVGKNGEELCWDCYKDQFLSKICDDMDETKCSVCGYDWDMMYQIEGNEWVCEDCLLEMAERVDTE